ncbi:MAG TPA: zinc ribbon domain-containing protein [Acidimicrobiales bacterium]|nr:zinc ribbon domain-containing protein [Acidimicrobiales bacterium]
MALYEYLCAQCDTSFEVRRSMAEADNRVTCPSGHTDVRRKLSMFASVGARGTGTATMASPGRASGGGCCGGACGCGR